MSNPNNYILQKLRQINKNKFSISELSLDIYKYLSNDTNISKPSKNMISQVISKDNSDEAFRKFLQKNCFDNVCSNIFSTQKEDFSSWTYQQTSARRLNCTPHVLL